MSSLLSFHVYFSMYLFFLFFFFNDTATTEIYTLSLHDALPISMSLLRGKSRLTSCKLCSRAPRMTIVLLSMSRGDRKSTRLNSSHTVISYAVFCLKKKKQKKKVVNIQSKVKRTTTAGYN